MIVYHRGDLSAGLKPRDTLWGLSPDRSTGFFGNGLYFCTQKDKTKTYGSSRPDKYYKISGNGDMVDGTIKLHNELRKINESIYEKKVPDCREASYLIHSSYYLSGYEEAKKVTEKQVVKICENIINEFDKKGWYIKQDDGSYYLRPPTGNIDSIPRRVLQGLGFDGVYPRKECDNTEYGGVIYNMKKFVVKEEQNNFGY